MGRTHCYIARYGSDPSKCAWRWVGMLRTSQTRTRNAYTRCLTMIGDIVIPAAPLGLQKEAGRHPSEECRQSYDPYRHPPYGPKSDAPSATPNASAPPPPQRGKPAQEQAHPAPCAGGGETERAQIQTEWTITHLIWTESVAVSHRSTISLWLTLHIQRSIEYIANVCKQRDETERSTTFEVRWMSETLRDGGWDGSEVRRSWGNSCSAAEEVEHMSRAA
ncbi:hypothetical protein BJ912DRAFT_974560 [Pholiota molesta]|nr:hypothetical protein BJ912DRAFT_974560 [Pholiota molesta]